MKSKRLLLSAVALALLLGGVLTVHFYRQAVADLASRPERLEVMGVLPPFALTERNGRSVTGDDLLGQIWLANFIFTNCTGPCPMLSSAMRRLQNTLDSKWPVRLVSVTVDPARDTPPVLAAYAARYGADAHRWWFLTGGEAEVYGLIREGFRLSAGIPAHPGSGQIAHSLQVVLVDTKGRLRATYNGLGPDLQQQVLADLRILMSEEEAAKGAAGR